MEFLKEILGDDLYAQVEAALNAHNGKPENAQAQVKIGNLGSGEYVSKAKYDGLSAEKTTAAQKLTEAETLIGQLQKAAKGDEGLQTKITEYQTKVTQLETELAQTKIDSAIKVGLLAENASDIDYLTFKLKEKGEKIELDEQGNIKGWDNMVAALKTQLPTQFSTAKGAGGKTEGFHPLDEDGKDNGSGGQAMTKESLLKLPYAERMKFFNDNPEGYHELMK